MRSKIGMGAAAVIVGSLVMGAPVAAKKQPDQTWQASKTTDPVTGVSSCVVAAYDRIGRNSFSRFGLLYPIVENNSTFGLLIGVSSGGSMRLPTGDILWRIDDKPFREIKAADNPVSASSIPAAPQMPAGVTSQAINSTIANAMRMSAAMMATSTVASGDKAKEMLTEMLGGTSLIFRAASAAPSYGLPSPTTYRVGQVTNAGLHPFPLDASFRAALAQCGTPIDGAR